MSALDRKRFLGALLEGGDEVQECVLSLLKFVKEPGTPPGERKRALMAIVDALCLHPSEPGGRLDQDSKGTDPIAAVGAVNQAGEVPGWNTQEESFAARLKELMTSRQISQRELADRIGCTQPAISQMLNRQCRPQKRTILKLAEALHADPRELWPDMEVAEMLDAVASFQEDDHTMTAEEANALKATARKNRPKFQAKSLPPSP